MRQRKRYDEAFKKKAIEYYLKKRGTLAGSAEHFGISPSMLSKWVERFALKLNENTSKPMDCEGEIKRLNAEVKALKNIVNKVLVQKFTADAIVDDMIDRPEDFNNHPRSA